MFCSREEIKLKELTLGHSSLNQWDKGVFLWWNDGSLYLSWCSRWGVEAKAYLSELVIHSKMMPFKLFVLSDLAVEMPFWIYWIHETNISDWLSDILNQPPSWTPERTYAQAGGWKHTIIQPSLIAWWSIGRSQQPSYLPNHSQTWGHGFGVWNQLVKVQQTGHLRETGGEWKRILWTVHKMWHM